LAERFTPPRHPHFREDDSWDNLQMVRYRKDTPMLVQRLSLIACALALTACAGSSDNFETAYSAHATRYAGEKAAAIQDYAGGRITDAQMQARIRAAGEALTATDAATGREQQRALAANTRAAPSPSSSNGNPCLFISCTPAAPTPPPATTAPAATPQSSRDATAASAPQPAEEHNSCLLISCN
jgi:hypothetical protein